MLLLSLRITTTPKVGLASTRLSRNTPRIGANVPLPREIADSTMLSIPLMVEITRVIIGLVMIVGWRMRRMIFTIILTPIMIVTSMRSSPDMRTVTLTQPLRLRTNPTTKLIQRKFTEPNLRDTSSITSETTRDSSHNNWVVVVGERGRGSLSPLYPIKRFDKLPKKLYYIFSVRKEFPVISSPREANQNRTKPKTK